MLVLLARSFQCFCLNDYLHHFPNRLITDQPCPPDTCRQSTNASKATPKCFKIHAQLLQMPRPLVPEAASTLSLPPPTQPRPPILSTPTLFPSHAHLFPSHAQSLLATPTCSLSTPALFLSNAHLFPGHVPLFHSHAHLFPGHAHLFLSHAHLFH
jgi:hypothetical protein